MCKTSISNAIHWVLKVNLKRKRKETCKVLSLGWEVRQNAGDSRLWCSEISEMQKIPVRLTVSPSPDATQVSLPSAPSCAPASEQLDLALQGCSRLV